MDLKDHLVTMARYHGWAYQTLLDKLVCVIDADYYADAGLFFGSLHRTLNHLLLVDQLWFGRFTGTEFPVPDLREELYHDRHKLAARILQQSMAWVAFAEAADPARFATDLHYLTTTGTPNRMPFFESLMHVFNHGTHHRGQVSAAMTRLGYESPEMDLYFYLRKTILEARSC